MTLTLKCPDCDRPIEVQDQFSVGNVVCPACRCSVPVQALGSYAIHEGKPCPNCQAECEPSAVLCIQCGYDFRTGRRVQKVVRVQPYNFCWMSGLIPLGMYTAGQLQRDEDGFVTLSVTEHYFFIPLARHELDLKEYPEVHARHFRGFGARGLILLLMLLFLGIIPGLGWIILAFTRDTYAIELPLRKDIQINLYEGLFESKWREILDVLKEYGQTEIVRK
jgi:hypothetical protein